MKTIHLSDIIKVADSVDQDLPVMIYCPYNTYVVSRIRLLDDCVVLDVGDPNNSVTEKPTYTDDVFDDDDYDSGPMIA